MLDNEFFQGGDAMSARLLHISGKFPAKIARAIHAEGRIEMREAIQRTPKDTGFLRDSYELPPAEIGPEIPFVGRLVTQDILVTATYAIYVHENLEVDHPIGEAKFLERTLQESAPYMGQRILRRAGLLE